MRRDHLSNEDFWRVTEHTLQNVLLPVLSNGHERDTVVQLIGVARYAKGARASALSGVEKAVGDRLGVDPSASMGAASRCLTEAVTKEGRVAVTPEAEAVRGILMAGLTAEVNMAAPLLESFAKHGRTDVGSTETELPIDWHEALTSWLSQELGEATVIQRSSVIPGGHSRKMVQLDLRVGGRPRDVILRAEQDGMFGTDGVRESRVMRALGGAGILVPPIVGADETGTVIGTRFFVMDVVRGRPELGEGDLERFAQHLHELHEMDPSRVASGFGEVPQSPDEAVAAQIDFWEGVYTGSSVGPIPLLDEAIRWLRLNLRPSGGVSVVHGDPGPGNFLVEDGRLTAMLDWEFAAIGDPAADWAYLATVRGRALRSPDEWKVWIKQQVGVEYDDTQWLAWEIFNRFKAVCADLTPFDIIRRGHVMSPNLVAIGAGIHKRFLMELSSLTASYQRALDTSDATTGELR